jgi:hypothetical protein
MRDVCRLEPAARRLRMMLAAIVTTVAVGAALVFSVNAVAEQPPTLARARALQILFDAGCVAPDPAVLANAPSILALYDQRGLDAVREALGCDGASQRVAHVHRDAEPTHVTGVQDSGLRGDENVRLVLEAPAATPTSESPPKPSPSPSAHPSQFGTTVGTDYNAKHFMLLFGAAVLNRFKLTRHPADKTMALQNYTLDGGSTAARAFVEAGVRYRWAWLDRLSPKQEGITRLIEDVDLRNAGASSKLRVESDRDNALVVERDGLLSIAGARVLQSRQRYREYSDRLESTLVAYRDAWQSFGDGMRSRSLISRCEADGIGCLVPGDLDGRLGYVFDSGSTTSASTILSGNDTYGQLGLGWRLVDWSFPTSEYDEVPIRGSVNFEPTIRMTTDSGFNDIHENYFVGASFVFGVPIPPRATSGDAHTRQIVAVLEGGPLVKPTPAPVVEFVAKIGATRTDVPVLHDSPTDDTVALRNGLPAFRKQWGLGFGLEINAPVPGNLGYVILRGEYDAELHPDPWVVQFGYTIPIGNALTGLGVTTK